ncbi:maleylpyruvate isomerase N-terminal domain-containing protein [Nocardioides marmorisolisilvae]|uniref:Maleylpyruvate isomerase family mycothiol-dependent enzyme n=1 Tax=Nocardioides marmorisolisilvae TaxID=1542737 RepID=A0A3N0DV30_9ACTN|nr:maleylpyruvate isomerase N-terminal domain-containing protein [Nocardioides marmorisolisilvae]RNL79489.1 maleylpyruvate isomerase family mycothiol-dependent enzyme [Nocardioides marmorisolisilvae]
MTTLAARTIDALRHEHDDLAAVVAAFTDAELTGPSGASEWSAAQVLSHLGSGSEIGLAGLQVALGLREPLDDSFNPSVWARWDAMGPDEQRSEYLRHNLTMVEAYEDLSADQRESLQVPVPYLPAPISVATYAGLRLSEATHHGWDARVAMDRGAALLDRSTAVLLEHLAGDLGFLLGFIGKADRIADDVVLSLGDSGYSIAITDTVSLASSADEPTATFSGPVEAALRLMVGRLGPAYTPAAVTVTGNVTLDELRSAFPGL